MEIDKLAHELNLHDLTQNNSSKSPVVRGNLRDAILSKLRPTEEIAQAKFSNSFFCAFRPGQYPFRPVAPLLPQFLLHPLMIALRA